MTTLESVLAASEPVVEDLLRRYRFRADERDDARQSVALALCEAWPRFDPSGAASATTWAFALARNVLQTTARDAQTERRNLAAVPALAFQARSEVHERPDVRYERAEARALVRRGVAALPAPWRDALTARALDEQPAAQVVAREGCTRRSVDARTHKAKAALRVALAGSL